MDIRTYSAKTQLATVVTVAFIVVLAVITAAWLLPLGTISYTNDISAPEVEVVSDIATTTEIATSTVFVATHISAPTIVKGAYYTSWAAGTPSFQKQMFGLIEGTELNSLVIDVKDYSGRISFPMDDPEIIAVGSVQKRIVDVEGMIAKLHEKGIYVIGRVAVFQDPFIIKVHPDWAVHDKEGNVWKDAGGSYWVDPDTEAMWKYTTAIAKGAYAVGFDEINFDYIRFPSDGISGAVFDISTTTTKALVLRNFFSYLHDELSPLGIPISVDVFGQTTSDKGDMGIGQHFENALPYFDYIDPMVYPSHYISGFLTFTKPAEHPYAVVKYELDRAVARSIADSTIASTTASSSEVLYSPAKIRPWLQAFDLGAIYTPAMVHTQMQATADAGAEGWLLWNAGSVYNREFVMPYERATTTAMKAKTVMASVIASTSTGAVQ